MTELIGRRLSSPTT